MLDISVTPGIYNAFGNDLYLISALRSTYAIIVDNHDVRLCHNTLSPDRLISVTWVADVVQRRVNYIHKMKERPNMAVPL